MGDEDNKVADVQVEKDEDSGTVTATVTKEDGSTSEGSSSPGILSDASTSEAIEDAKD